MATRKLQELRSLLEQNESQYPTAYHLAIKDGCYDVALIERAMRDDIFTVVAKQTAPLNPFNPILSLTPEHLKKEKDKIEALDGIARRLALSSAKRHNVKAAVECINFIHEQGRNSQAARTLVSTLQPPYVENNPHHTKVRQLLAD